MNGTWIHSGPTRWQRLQMVVRDNWALLAFLFRAGVSSALVCVAIYGVYCFGFVRGEMYAEGCSLDHRQESIAVLAFRDANDQLHCQYKANPFHAPRIKG